MQDAQKRRELSGRHVLLALVGFFTIVFAVNGVLAVCALRTNTGVVAVEPYRKGLDYNRRIEADARQQALGWQASASVMDGRLEIDMKSADGRPLSGLNLDATAGRPATMAENVRMTVNETASGHYVSDVSLAGRGAFIADVAVIERGEAVYRFRRRLWVKP